MRPPLPPRWLDKLATKICAPHLREELLGDLHERYAMRHRRMGTRKANLFFLREVAALLRPSIMRRKPSPYPSPSPLSPDMLRNYFKIGTRVLLKNGNYSLIHITGLSMGLWACMMVATVVIDSLSYDRQWSRKDDIYRIVSVDKKSSGLRERIASSNAALPPEMQKLFPEMEAASSLTTIKQHFRISRTDKNDITTNVLKADTSVWKMLDIHVLSGRPRHFQEGYPNLVVSKSFAARYFPDKDPVGEFIYLLPNFNSKTEPFLITGVVGDLPYNSHLRADVMEVEKPYNKPFSPTGMFMYSENYMMLRQGTDIASFTKKVNRWHQSLGKAFENQELEFQPITDIYLHSEFATNQSVKGNAQTIYIFCGIAALLLLIACVNFVNLSTAKALARLKETGVRKVLSGSRAQLIIQFLTETLILFGLSLVTALGIYWFSLKPVESFLGHRLIETLLSNPGLAVNALLVIIGTALFTGLYPAWLISGFKPANSLRGIFNASFGQSKLRKGLVVLQFSISVAVLLATIVVWEQLHLLENKDLGYKKENLLCIPSVSWEGKSETFKNEVLQIPGALHASSSLWTPANGGGYMMRQVPDPHNPEKRILVWFIAGDSDLPATLGLKLVKGRLFDTKLSTDALNADSLQKIDFMKFEMAQMEQKSLITESAAHILGIKKLDEKMKDVHTTPVGIIADFNNESLYEPIKPTVILAQKSPEYAGMLIRVQPHTEARIMAAISEKWKQFFPDKLLEINVVEDLLHKQYETEARMHQLFIFFSGLTMFLSALGIFGLVVQAAEQRAKEVGIRKVLGASVSGIVGLLSRDFVTLVVVAIALASPIAWYALNKWLAQYPYRTAIDWWVFVATGAIALLVTIVTVSFQAFRAAMADPVRSLRNE